METVQQATTLYQKLGGEEGIRAIVDDVIEAHMNNPVISARFLPYRDQPEHLDRIKQHNVDFFGAGSGGPQQYRGRDMTTAHEGMNINATEYMAVIDDVMGVLQKHAIEESAQKDVLHIFYSLKGQMIGK